MLKLKEPMPMEIGMIYQIIVTFIITTQILMKIRMTW